MNTAFLLLAQYNGRAVIPTAEVVRDYFPHLDVRNFLRKVSTGGIKLALVRIESQRATRGIALKDLAEYIDARRAAAKKELAQLIHGTPPPGL